MLNILETPWFLIIISVLLFFVQRILRSINPDKFTNKYLFIPLAIFVFAFFADFIVETDNEKINSMVKTIKKSVINEKTDEIELLISPNYYDPYHRSKDRAVSHLKSLYIISPVEMALITEKEILKNDEKATINIKAGLTFEPGAPLGAVSVKFSLDLVKNANGQWLISSSELEELNKQPVSWGDIP